MLGQRPLSHTPTLLILTILPLFLIILWHKHQGHAYHSGSDETDRGRNVAIWVIRGLSALDTERISTNEETTMKIQVGKKYKGKDIKDVPDWYLIWILEKFDDHYDLKAAIREKLYPTLSPAERHAKELECERRVYAKLPLDEQLPPSLIAWGENKYIEDWAEDPRCRCSLETLQRRVCAAGPYWYGDDDEGAISTPE